MASKTVTISPTGAEAAGCTATCGSYHQGVVPPSYQGGNTLAYTNYQVVATGVGNWRPINIKVSHFYTYSDGSTSTETITYRSSNYGDPNPWNFPSAKSYTERENPFEFTETDPGTEWRVRTVDDTITGVEVEFYESTPPTPTTYTITTAVSPAGGGTTTGDGTYAAGASCTITATPAAGYVFLRWEKNGVQVSSNPTYVFTVSESATYTAVFGSSLVTVALVAHNGWGNVCFEGETPSTTVQKTVPSGTTLRIIAIRIGSGPIPHYWRGPSGSSSLISPTRTITPTADETWEAFFYYEARAMAVLDSDPTTPANVGEVRIVYDNGHTAWADDMVMRIYDGTSTSRIRFEQRASNGFTFVKWRYRAIGSESWYDSTGIQLTVFLDGHHWEAVAVFRRTPTDLLVNSSNRSTPVQLVYDDRTGGAGKLIADY